MTLPASIRVNAQFPFPALVVGSGLVTVTKKNGIWTLGFSIAGLGVATPPLSALPTDYIVVYDAVANTYFRMPLSAFTASVGTIRMPASAAAIAITTSDIEVGIDTRTTAVSATLPSVVAWSAANQNGLELTLVDINGNAAANNITPALNGADTFFYGGVTPIITSPFGLLKLRPAGNPVSGWYVRGIN